MEPQLNTATETWSVVTAPYNRVFLPCLQSSWHSSWEMRSALLSVACLRGYRGIYTSKIAKIVLRNCCRICCQFSRL